MIRYLQRVVVGVGVALSPLTTALAGPAFNTYATAVAFTNAVPDAALESFTQYVAPGRTNSPGSYDFGPFVASKAYTIRLNIAGPTGGPSGAWRGRPTTDLPDQFVFDEALKAWAADFKTSIGREDDLGIVLSVLTEGSWYSVGTIGVGLDPDDTFFGFESDTPFNAVRVLSFSRPHDAYLLDNMYYLASGTIPTTSTSVPEPVGIAVFGLGLIGIAAAVAQAGRRRRIELAGPSGDLLSLALQRPGGTA